MIRLGLFAAAIGAVALMPRAPSAQGEAECPADLYPMQKIQCLLDAAQRRSDPEPCLTAEDPVRFQCVSLYAESAKDEGACALLSGSGRQARILRDTCVVGVALAAVDPELCERAEDANLTDICYVQVVLERGADTALCGRIENPRLRASCGNP